MIKNIASTSFKCKHCALHFAYGYSKLSPFSISERVSAVQLSRPGPGGCGGARRFVGVSR